MLENLCAFSNNILCISGKNINFYVFQENIKTPSNRTGAYVISNRMDLLWGYSIFTMFL